MSLVAFDGTPLVIVGGTGSQGGPSLNNSTNNVNTLNAALKAAIFIGQIHIAGGGSKTIDTTASSSIQWRSGSVTFANAGTSVSVGIGTVDTATGPAARATNVTGTITQSVASVLTGGGGGITANAWQTSVPTTGTMTIAHGDIVAVSIQMVTRGGADTVGVQAVTPIGSSAPTFPVCTSFDGVSTYTAATVLPNVLISFSDGTLGWIFGGFIWATAYTSQSFANNTAKVEYGNYFLMPVPTKIYGLAISCSAAGNFDAVLYTDPLGTPASAKSQSFDLNVIGQAANTVWFPVLFTSPYTSTASQPLAGIIKPTSTTAVTCAYKSFAASAHQVTESLGTKCYAINRASGAFAAQNSSKDRFAISLLVAAFDDGVSVGGISRARAQSGF